MVHNLVYRKAKPSVNEVNTFLMELTYIFVLRIAMGFFLNFEKCQPNFPEE
jgi:hypothetical protein